MQDPVITLTVVLAVASVVAIVFGLWCSIRARDHETAETRALTAGATPAEARAAGRLAARCAHWRDGVGAAALTLTVATVLTPTVLGALLPSF